MSNTIWLFRCERLLLTVWVGGQIAIAYLAVPLLFHHLDDRILAGALAGEMFRWIHVLGLSCGSVLLFIACIYGRKYFYKQWRFVVLVIMIILLSLGLFLLQPLMAEIKLEDGWREQAALASQFGRLHGMASIAYLLSCILGLVLVMLGIRKP